jgi:hypothetical protein
MARISAAISAQARLPVPPKTELPSSLSASRIAAIVHHAVTADYES